MTTKRMFESVELPVRIVGAGTIDAALSQLRKNRNYAAILIDLDEAEDMGLELACAVKEETGTPVVVFQRKWGHNKLHMRETILDFFARTEDMCFTVDCTLITRGLDLVAKHAARDTMQFLF